MELDNLTKIHEEWEAWKGLCVHLEGTGAVTMEDLESSAGASDTRGQVVLNKIRAWGDALVALRMSEKP